MNIKEIKGKTPIDASGTTVGTVVLNDGTEHDIIYKASDINDGNLISQVQTTDESGNVYDVFEATASTLKVENDGLTFPFDEDINLSNADRNIGLVDNLTMNTADDLISVATQCWNKVVSLQPHYDIWFQAKYVSSDTFQYDTTPGR